MEQITNVCDVLPSQLDMAYLHFHHTRSILYSIAFCWSLPSTAANILRVPCVECVSFSIIFVLLRKKCYSPHLLEERSITFLGPSVCESWRLITLSPVYSGGTMCRSYIFIRPYGVSRGEAAANPPCRGSYNFVHFVPVTRMACFFTNPSR